MIMERIDTDPVTTTTLALPDDTPYPHWLSVGRSLASQKRNIDWLIGDWIAFGRTHFPEQIELALADLADDPNRIKRIERTTATFPPHLRQPSLTFDHHAHVADMPVQEALPLLQHAAQEKMTARALRIEAMLRKVEIGQILPREDDAEDECLLAMVRAWNRATRHAREEFADMIAETHFGLIEF